MALYYFNKSEYLPDVYYTYGNGKQGDTPYKLADGFTYEPNIAYRTDKQMPYVPLTEEERKQFNITNENFDNYYYNLGLAQTGGSIKYHGKKGLHTATPEQLITAGKYILRGGIVPTFLDRGGVFHNGQFRDDTFNRLENQIEQAKKDIEWFTDGYAKDEIAGGGRVGSAYSGYKQEALDGAYRRLGEAQKAYDNILNARKGLEEVRGGKVITRNSLPQEVQPQQVEQAQEAQVSSFSPVIDKQVFATPGSYQMNEAPVVTPQQQQDILLSDKYLAEQPDANITQRIDKYVSSDTDPYITNTIDKYLTN